VRALAAFRRERVGPATQRCHRSAEPVRVIAMFLIPTSTVRCAQCARLSGRIENGVFMPETSGARPTAARGGSRCGHCGGGLYLDPEVVPSPAQAAYVAAVRQRVAR
jgi:hypothetical protein